MNVLKRLCSIAVVCAMLIPSLASGSFAAVEVSDNWRTLAAKYSTVTDRVIAPDGIVKTDGFEFTVNDENGIDVTVPDGDTFKGVKPVAAITSKTATALDGLQIEIDPFPESNDGVTARSFSFVWSQSEISEICDPDTQSGLYLGNSVYANGLRHLVDASVSDGLCVTVKTGEKDGRYVGVEVDVVIYSRGFYDPTFRPGYRWIFGERESLSPKYPGNVRDAECIDLSGGLVFSVRPDSELGYAVLVNGKDYCRSYEASYYPLIKDPFNNREDDDLSEMHLAVVDPQYYAPYMYDLTMIESGYITVGAVGSNEADPNMDFTVKSVNGIPAALWDGHSHTWGADAEYLAPDCENEGGMARSCTGCSYSEELTISPLGHVEKVRYDIVSSTCSTPGSYRIDCSVCNESVLFTEGLLPHTYDDNGWKVETRPGYYTYGTEYRDCTVCSGGRETRVLDRFENPFGDVAAGKWYTDAVLYCFEKGYMTGISEGVFGYKATVDRQMFATILAKIDGADTSSYTEMSFTDVEAGKWYSNAIEWAYRNGYASGMGAGVFGRKTPVTREQMAMFFYTYSEKNGIDVSGRADITCFADYARIHSYAVEALAWAVNAGIITGTSDTTISPRDSAVRIQVAVIVMNYVEYVKNPTVEEPAPEVPEPTPQEPLLFYPAE